MRWIESIENFLNSEWFEMATFLSMLRYKADYLLYSRYLCKKI